MKQIQESLHFVDDGYSITPGGGSIPALANIDPSMNQVNLYCLGSSIVVA